MFPFAYGGLLVKLENISIQIFLNMLENCISGQNADQFTNKN